MNGPRSIADIDFAALTKRKYTPSPDCWSDQVLYFLMLDRFSDGRERGGYKDTRDQPVTTGTTPLATTRRRRVRCPTSNGSRQAGGWQGGTLAGPEEQAGLPPPAGCDGDLDQPRLQTGGIRADVSRLRHPELPRDRSSLRDAGGSARPGRRRPRGRGSTASSTSSSTTPATSSTTGTCGISTAMRVASGSPIRAGTASPTTSPDSATSKAARRCRSTRRRRPHSTPPGRTARSGPGSFRVPGPSCAAGRITNWDHYPEFEDADFFDLKKLNLSVDWSGRYPKLLGIPSDISSIATCTGSPMPTSTASASTPSSTWAGTPRGCSVARFTRWPRVSGRSASCSRAR